MNDLHNNCRTVVGISPVAIGANATKTGLVKDRQGYGGVEFIVSFGAVTTTGTVVTMVAMEGDVTGTMTSIADTDLLGTEALAAFQFDDDNECRKLGYIGAKRYTRLTITPVNNASAAVLSAVAILGHPASAPTANPPV